MTRREMREHCFKILFGVEFYPTEEIKTQVEQYFDAPEEDDVAENGTEEMEDQPHGKGRAYHPAPGCL